MAHAIVQIHPDMHHSQQQQLCKRYDIPNIPYASSASSDDEHDYNGGHASLSPANSNSVATSFISIDGDYDDAETVEAVVGVDVGVDVGVVMPLFAGGYVVATFATAPPIDNDNVMANVPENSVHAENNKHHKHNKIKSRPTNPKQIEEGAEICIICYEGIEEERGDFQRNFCNTCKYTVHLGCIDDYIVRKVRDAVQVSRISSVGIKCLICSKEVERVILYEDNNLNAGINENNNGDRVGAAEQRRQLQLHQQALDIMVIRLNRERRNRCKQLLCNVCFLILIVSCGLAVLLSIITKK
jgi:hypothetical protein